jgi:hypothetical protein
MYVVPGVLLGLFLRTRIHQVIFAVLYLTVFTTLFEGALMFTSGRAFEPDNVATTAIIGAGVLAVLVCTLSQTDTTVPQPTHT